MSEHELPDPGMANASAHYTNEEAQAWVNGTEHMREIAMGVIEQVEAERDYVRDELNGIHNRLRDLAGVEWQGQPTTDDLMGAVEKLVHDLRRDVEKARTPRTWPMDGTEPPRDVVWEDGVGDHLTFFEDGWYWSRIAGVGQFSGLRFPWAARRLDIEGDTLTEVIGA